jgi:hypothetical protein
MTLDLRSDKRAVDAGSLERDIDRIASAAASARSGSRVEWRDLWNEIKSTGAAFKQTQFGSREDRENAWQRFQAAVEQVKAEQTRQREQREQRSANSKHHLEHILNLVNAAAPDDGLFRIMMTAITGGTNLLLEAGLDALFGKQDEVFTELHRRSGLLREAGQYLSAHKAGMLGADKATAFDSIKNQRERLDGDWAQWKETMRAAKATRHEDYLQRQARREERDAKQRAWRENQISYVARLESALERLGAARNRRREHRSELYDKRSSAWSDGYRERIDGWIAEEESNIADIEDKMREVADKLENAKSKL